MFLSCYSWHGYFTTTRPKLTRNCQRNCYSGTALNNNDNNNIIEVGIFFIRINVNWAFRIFLKPLNYRELWQFYNHSPDIQKNINKRDGTQRKTIEIWVSSTMDFYSLLQNLFFHKYIWPYVYFDIFFGSHFSQFSETSIVISKFYVRKYLEY